MSQGQALIFLIIIMNAPLQVNQLAQKVIPQKIIRTIVTFADKENN